jgi:Transglutaminase-like superfamily
MWEQVQRFRALAPEARNIFFRAAVLLPAISFSLRLRGFGATQQSLQNLSVPSNAGKYPGEDVASGDRVEMAVRMVNAAARYGWGRPTCLEKSLMLWSLLRRQGTASSVRIGARKVDGKFEAHAWVERDGVALNEPGDEHRHYATFDAAFPLQSSESP